VRAVLAETPSFAPQVQKVLGPGWLTVDEVGAALEAVPVTGSAR
jgi:energy-coupling factor transport system ATP-binding protein